MQSASNQNQYESAKDARIVNLPTKPNTVIAAIAADLLGGQRITHKDCWLRHGSNRLSHHIYMLRKSGWPIESPEITVPTSDGRQQSIAQYHVLPGFIDLAGERGRRFVEDVRRAREQTRRYAA